MKATEMEERVARAMLAAISPGDRLPFLDEINEFPERALTRLARVAIRAMREPTAEMCEEVTGMFMGSDIRRMAASTFRRMIDVASPAKPLPDAPQGALPK